MENQQFNILFRFNHDLRSIADKIIDAVVNVTSNKEMFAVFCFGKAYKTHGAVLLLCQNGLGQDAAMLMRSLIDLLVTLFYILNDPTEERLQRYFAYDWVLRKKMLDYCKSRPEISSLMPEIDANEVENQSKIAKEKYKYDKPHWSDKNIREMAEEIGRPDLYATVYSLQSQILHTAPRALNEYIKNEHNGYVVDVGQNDSWIEETLVASFDCYFHIVQKCDELLNLGKAFQLVELKKQYETEVEYRNKLPI